MSAKLFRPMYLTLAALCVVVGVAGCQLPFSKGSIRSGETRVTAPKDAGTPATLNTATQRGSLRLPANSKITRTEVAAQPATQTQPALPAQSVTVVENSEPTEWIETKDTVVAGTGTIDTSVAKHRIDAEDRRWLLFTAIGCALAGLVMKSMLPAWLGLSNGLLLGAALSFASWKLADVPSWAWLLALGGAALLALGYKRRELDANNNGIPDRLEK